MQLRSSAAHLQLTIVKTPHNASSKPSSKPSSHRRRKEDPPTFKTHRKNPPKLAATKTAAAPPARPVKSRAPPANTTAVTLNAHPYNLRSKIVHYALPPPITPQCSPRSSPVKPMDPALHRPDMNTPLDSSSTAIHTLHLETTAQQRDTTPFDDPLVTPPSSSSPPGMPLLKPARRVREYPDMTTPNLPPLFNADGTNNRAAISNCFHEVRLRQDGHDGQVKRPDSPCPSVAHPVTPQSLNEPCRSPKVEDPMNVFPPFLNFPWP